MREIDACDGRLPELISALEQIACHCRAESAWYMIYDATTKRDMAYLPWRFPDEAKTWRTDEGIHPWQLWTDFASSLPEGDLMQTGRFDRALAMRHLELFFREFDCIQTVGYVIKLGGRECAGLGLFRADRKGPFHSDATHYICYTADAFRRFSWRNFIRRSFSNPFDGSGPSLEMFRQRLKENGVLLGARLTEALWLFYLGFSDKESAERMKPTEQGRQPAVRTVIALIEKGREYFSCSNRVSLMRHLTMLVVSPLPGDRNT